MKDKNNFFLILLSLNDQRHKRHDKYFQKVIYKNPINFFMISIIFLNWIKEHLKLNFIFLILFFLDFSILLY